MAEIVKTNPYGANGTTSDPREQIMWDFYIEGLSKGIDNAQAAAIKAGYELKSARQITVRSWFIARKQELVHKEMLSDAEKVLKKTLRYNVEKVDKATGEVEIKTDLLRIQNEAARHITKSLGKQSGWESEAPQGNTVNNIIVLSNEQLQRIARRTVDGNTKS